MPVRLPTYHHARRLFTTVAAVSLPTRTHAQVRTDYQTTAAKTSTSTSTISTCAYARRERATQLLTIAATMQPAETANALRRARSTIRNSLSGRLHPHDASFLQNAIKDTMARAIACFTGGAVTGYTILKLTFMTIPYVPSLLAFRVGIVVVALSVVILELASVVDVITVEFLLLRDGRLPPLLRRQISCDYPHLILSRQLQSVGDRSAGGNDACAEASFVVSHLPPDGPSLCDAFDR